MRNDTSSTNTILLVILVVLVALGIVWFIGGVPQSDKQSGSADINVTLPTSGSDSDGQTRSN